MESYRVGSVAWSMKHFADGTFTAAGAFRAAEISAKAVLDDALGSYTRDQWDVAYGASGTIGAVGDVLAASGAEPGLVTRAGLDWLLERLLKAGSADKLRIDGMREDRKAVIGGGVSVLRAVFDLLDIDRMKVAQGALRHGVLYELLERDDSVADLRAATVERLATKFMVDAGQAKRVGDTAASLFRQIEPAAAAATVSRPGRSLRKLGWAAQLHEIGAQISHSDYHKHGAYILDHADGPGFASNELHWLSLLVLGHRGKLRKLETMLDDEAFVGPLLALRLAVILCHARRDPEAGAPAPDDGLPVVSHRVFDALGRGVSAIGVPARRGSRGLAEDGLARRVADQLACSARLPLHVWCGCIEGFGSDAEVRRAPGRWRAGVFCLRHCNEPGQAVVPCGRRPLFARGAACLPLAHIGVRHTAPPARTTKVSDVGRRTHGTTSCLRPSRSNANRRDSQCC